MRSWNAGLRAIATVAVALIATTTLSVSSASAASVASAGTVAVAVAPGGITPLSEPSPCGDGIKRIKFSVTTKWVLGGTSSYYSIQNCFTTAKTVKVSYNQNSGGSGWTGCFTLAAGQKKVSSSSTLQTYTGWAYC